MKMHRSNIIRYQRSLAMALVLLSFSLGATATETIRIGVSCPFTGGSADMGISVRNGIRLAAEEINEWAGGVIELLERDDLANPEVGKNDVEKALAAQNLAPVSVQRFALGVTDLSEQVNQAKTAGADLVISYTVGPEAVVLAKSIAKQKWNVQIVGSWPLSWRNFIDPAGDAAEGALVAVSFIQQANFQRRKAFISAYEEKYNSPVIAAPMAAAQGYDAMMILFYAIHQAQSDDPVKIKVAPENLQRPVSGVITTYDKPFSKTDHDALSSNMLVMGVVRKGQIDYAYKQDAQKSFVVPRKAP